MKIENDTATVDLTVTVRLTENEIKEIQNSLTPSWRAQNDWHADLLVHLKGKLNDAEMELEGL